MTEPTIIFPHCKSEIKLTDSLAAPLIEATRRDYEQRMAKKDLDFAKRESSSEQTFTKGASVQILTSKKDR